MKLNFLKTFVPPTDLYNQDTFYPCFLSDLQNARCEVIIESPYITNKRIIFFEEQLRKLKSTHVKVIINTRPPLEHDSFMRKAAETAITQLLIMGVQVIYTPGLHRKLAIIDRSIIWDGSLNILSQSKSLEQMRRNASSAEGWRLIKFTRLDDKIN